MNERTNLLLSKYLWLVPHLHALQAHCNSTRGYEYHPVAFSSQSAHRLYYGREQGNLGLEVILVDDGRRAQLDYDCEMLFCGARCRWEDASTCSVHIRSHGRACLTRIIDECSFPRVAHGWMNRICYA